MKWLLSVKCQHAEASETLSRGPGAVSAAAASLQAPAADVGAERLVRTREGPLQGAHRDVQVRGDRGRRQVGVGEPGVGQVLGRLGQRRGEGGLAVVEPVEDSL